MRLLLLAAGIFMLCHGTVTAQSPTFSVAPDVGMVSLTSSLKENNFIRGDIPSFSGYYEDKYSYYSSSTVRSQSIKSHFGVKALWTPVNRKFDLETGIRYNTMNNILGEENPETDNPRYLYWRINEDAVNTDYIRVVSFSQINKYLTIPIELRYFLLDQKNVRYYVKAGCELNMLLSTGKTLTYLNSAMQKYDDRLLSMTGDSAPLSASVYGAGGIKIGNTYAFSVELVLPYVWITKENNALLSPGTGAGIQAFLEIPLNIAKP